MDQEVKLAQDKRSGLIYIDSIVTYIFFISKIYTKKQEDPQLQMHSNSHPFEVQNVGQLRAILEDISLQNEPTIKEQLAQYLEDQNHLVRSNSSLNSQGITRVCIQELAKKQQYLANLLQFSHHLLNDVEAKNDSLHRANEQLAKLQTDFDQLLVHSEEMAKRAQLVEEQNSHFKQKIEEAETYITEASRTQSLKSSLEYLPEISSNQIQVLGLSPKNHVRLTERPSTTPLPAQSVCECNTKINAYENQLIQKSLQIEGLEDQLNQLKSRIFILENELSAKSSELELSELYFKQKLDLIALNQSQYRSHEVSISEIEVNSVFKKDLLRVDSAKSFQSVIQSQTSEHQSQSHYQTECFEQELAHPKRSSIVRLSLMQDFATDFTIQPNPPACSSIFDKQSTSQNMSCVQRLRKKSISVSTADIKRTATRAVQTCFYPSNKIVRKNIEQKPKKLQKLKNQLQSSFLGLGSIGSIFSKTSGIKEHKNCEQILKQDDKCAKNDHSILGQSSIGDIFKGILDYATKKIVTNRIQKKSKINLNQSFTEETNGKICQKKGYFKKMKN